MKLNGIELKEKLWFKNPDGYPFQIVGLWSERDAFEFQYVDRDPQIAYCTEPYYRKSTLLTPAELKAAGIADADRLCEQQSWREGVRLWDTPNSYTDKHCWVSIDSDVTVATVSRSAIVDDKPIAKAPGIDVPEIEVTNRDNYSWAWQAPHLRDFVLNFRSARAAEGKRLSDGTVLKAGDVTTHDRYFYLWEIKNAKLNSLLWTGQCFKDEGNGDYSTDDERLITPADAPELLKQNFPIEKLPADVRQAVEALRRPTLPDGSEVKVGEMYVSNRGWLQRVLVRSVSGDTWQRDYFDPNCKRWLSGMPVDGYGQCSSTLNCLARLAKPYDIPNEIDISIVPSRIREQVRQHRGAGALKWNGWYIFRQLGNEQQRWEFGQWVPVPDPRETIDEMATASPAQIIAANVPDADIPACQIEGVREERVKQAKKETDWLNGVHYDLKLTVVSQNGAAADSILNELISTNYKTCVVNTVSYDNATWKNKDGKLKAVPVSPSSPSPESGACKCEAANTLRDLIEAFDGWNDAKTHASLTEGYQSLRRKFELARESLGEASNTEAA